MSPEKKASGRLPIRDWLRIAGPALVLVGIAFLAVSSIDFFAGRQSAQAEFVGDEEVARTVDPPKYRWAFWAGVPLIAIGIVVTAMGGDELFVAHKDKDSAKEPAERRTMDQPLGQWIATKSAKRRADKRDRNA